MDCADWGPDGPVVASPFRYTGRGHDLVHALKYAGWTGLAGVMGRMMAGSAARLATDRSCCLVPVPLSAARLRERGFNQSELLAHGLGAAAGYPVRPLLVRHVSSRPQALSTPTGRAGNVDHAFEVRASGARRREPGEAWPVIVVDDVVTTGATARACADALREADMECLGIVAFARTLTRIDGCE